MTDTTCYAVSRPDGNGIQKHTALDGSPWYWGHVRTPQGFVSVYSEARASMLGFIANGREYTRRFDKGFQPRRLVTLAARFSEETSHDR